MIHGWSWRDVLRDTGLEMTLVASKRSATAVLLCCLLHSSVQYLASSVVARKSAIAVFLHCLQLASQIVEHLMVFAHVAPSAGAWPNFSLAPLDLMALMMRHKMGWVWESTENCQLTQSF